MSEREELRQAGVRALEELWATSDEDPRGVWADVVDCVLNAIESLQPQWRKLEPSDEVTRAKERVVEAAKEWRAWNTSALHEMMPSRVQDLAGAVDALEALEKPSLEDDLRTELEDLVFKVTDASSEDEGVAPTVTRILAIIEKHKGEE